MAGLVENISLIGDEIPWLKALRRKGEEAFLKSGVPGAKTEAWKYLKPKELATDDYVFSCGGCSQKVKQEIPFSCYRICFENGRFCPEGSFFPEEIEVLPLIEAILTKSSEIQFWLKQICDLNKFPFAALNQKYLNEGVYIHLPQGFVLDKPLVLDVHTSCEDKNLFSNLHNVVVLDKSSKAEVVEYYHYDGELKSHYFNNVVNQIFVGKGANLKHIKFQNEAFKASHIAFSHVLVDEKGLYDSFCLQRGADLARNESRVILRQQEAECVVNAAYKIDGWAKVDTTTDVEHLAVATKSHQLVKGVIGGQAKGIFQGKIHIAQDCVATEGNQLHKALLLSDEAEVDVKPELEIFADDVKCSHGAASGELDEEQLFYMRSRGIGYEEARQLLISAYFEEVFALLDNQDISNWLKSFL